MARQILPIAGAIVGGMIGGPAGAQIGFAAGSLIGNAVDPMEVQGNRVGDSPMQTASEGGARAIVFGKGCIRSTCLLERGSRIVKKQRDKAGKGGGPVTINERVFWTFAIGLGEDLVGGAILRIWEGEKLVYDVTPTSPIPAESAEFAKKFRFYDGAEDQLPDPDLEAIHGVGNAPYYRGTAYAVFPNFDLTDYREAIPTYRWEVAKDVSSVPLERIGNLSANVAIVQDGAVPINGLTEYEVDFSSPPPSWLPYTDGEYLKWQPLLLAEAGIMRGAQTAVRGQVLDDLGIVVADSGWIGDPAWQSVLDTILYIRERPDLSGPIIGYGTAGPGEMVPDEATIGSSVWMEIRLPSSRRLHRLRTYRSGGSTSISTGIALLLHMPNPPALPPNAQPYSGMFGVFTSDTGIYAAKWGPDSIAISDGSIGLDSVIAALHNRCGHTAGDYSVAELSDTMKGVIFEASVTGAEAINSLLGGYFADPADYDGQIHYIKRGKPVVRTLAYDDLVDEPETTRRENAIEYPRKLHLFAQTSWTAYAATKATSSRSSPDLNAVVGEVSVAIPVTFDGPDEPAQIAAKLHKVNWTDAAGEIVWQITDEHADLVPTDCVGLFLRGRVTRARITDIEDTPGIRKLTMRVDRQSAYTSDVTGVPLPLPTPPQPSILSPTVNAYMDIPALRDSDDAAAPVYYNGMSGQTDVWPGAALQRSLDGGASFSTVTVAPLNAIMGLLQNAVADASSYYTDNGNEVVVKLYMDDELDSLTNPQFKSEGGAFALSWMDGVVRRWEIMQYRDAEEIADKTYRLTTLHRGRLNSTAAAHPVGSMFVLLDGAVRVLDAQAAWIGTDLTHRAVTNGLSPEMATQQTEPFAALSQTEWPVAHVLLDHDGDDLHVEIVPRHRFGTALNPIRSINWTGYRIAATDGVNVLAVDVMTDTHTLDVTGWASPITVTVAQLNRITGAGPTVTEATP